MRRYWLLKGAAAIVLAPGVRGRGELRGHALWNALIPSLFAGPVLGFWQAVGLLVLCRILLGGFRGHGRHHGWRQRAWGGRWHSMTPEERDRFRDGIRKWHRMSHEERREFHRGFGGCGARMAGESGEPKGT